MAIARRARGPPTRVAWAEEMLIYANVRDISARNQTDEQIGPWRFLR